MLRIFMEMEKSFKHLEFIESKSQEIIDRYYKSNISDVQPYFYLGLLERLYAATIGFKHLLDKLLNNPWLEYSFGLIMRTTLLDFLYGLKGYDIHIQGKDAHNRKEDTDSALAEYCNSNLAAGVIRTSRYFVTTYDKGHYDKATVDNALGNLSIMYSTFVEPYAGDQKALKSKFKGGMNGTEIYASISDNPNIKNLAKHFEKYAMFSKYEHFSAMSFDVLRRPIEQQIPTIEDAIEIFVLHLFICTYILNEYFFDEFTQEKIKHISDYISKEVFDLKNES